MASKTIEYLAGGPDGKIRVKSSVHSPKDDEVVVRVTHSGVCGTDVHDSVDGCGLGHEGVGVVEEIGSKVSEVKVGQRVGWGWLHTACEHCSECAADYRQYCNEASGQKYGNLNQGAFGTYVIRRQDFVFIIPDEVESKYAGPLSCAGATMYEALVEAKAQSTDRVGIIGLGGLGHLGVMYSRALGCEVTVFSRTEDKREDAMALGASEFHLLPSESESTVENASKINVMLLAAGTVSDLGFVMPLLAPRARILPLAIQVQPFSVPFLPWFLPGHQIIASKSGSRNKAIETFRLAAKHNIKPWIEEFPMSVDGLEQAMAALKSGRIRYRAVLSTEVEGAGF